MIYFATNTRYIFPFSSTRITANIYTGFRNTWILSRLSIEEETKHVRCLCKYAYVPRNETGIPREHQHPSARHFTIFTAATIETHFLFGHCLRIVSIRDLILPRSRRKRNRKVSTQVVSTSLSIRKAIRRDEYAGKPGF